MTIKNGNKDPFKARPPHESLEDELPEVKPEPPKAKVIIAQEQPANKISGIPPMEYRIVSKTGVPCIDWRPQTIGDSMISPGGQHVEFAFNHPTDFSVYSPSGARLERM